MIDLYGERFIRASDFERYCRDLNVRVFLGELEHYEKSCLMLPVARTIAPAEVALTQYSADRVVMPESWARLRPTADFTDVDHPFDRELGRNEYVHRPSGDDYAPWSDYSVEMPGKGYRVSTVESYYAYWQVHQLHDLQTRPEFFCYSALIRKLPPEQRRDYEPWNEVFLSLHGWAQSYDVLSLFLSREQREWERTRRALPEKDGLRRFSHVDTLAHDDRIRALAEETAKTRRFTLDDLYLFVRWLLERHKQYEREERTRLMRSVERDLASCARLAQYAFDVPWELFTSDASPNPWDLKALRRLDPFTRNRDEAESTVAYLQHVHAIDTGSAELPAPDAEAERHALLQFCEESNLLEVLEALGEFHFTLEERRDSEPGFAIRRLRHSALAFESFAKAIAGDRIRSGQTLVPFMKDMTREIAPSAGTKLTKLSVNRPGDAASRVRELTPGSSPEQVASYVATCLACACLARNAAAHLPLLGWRSYEDQRTLEFLAGRTAQSFLELWRLATAVGWV